MLFRQVRGHDDEGVLEVHHPPFVIRQTTVIQYLQQHIEHIRMGFLDLIEQDNRVGFPTDCFCQLTSFIVSHVSRRCTDESGGTELLLVLGHIDTRDHIFVIEQVVCQGLCQLGLTDTGRTQEDKTADRSFRILQSCPATSYRITHGHDRLILTDDPFVQFFLQMQ